MAEDKSYAGNVRRLQGGDVLEIGSSGAIVETLQVRHKAATPTIPNFGYHSVGSSSGATAPVLAAPSIGKSVVIVGATGMGITGNNVVIQTSAAGILIGSTFGKITFTERGSSIHLIGQTAAIYQVVSKSSGVALAVHA